MSFEFNEEKTGSATSYQKKPASGMAVKLVALGVVRDTKQADALLAGVALFLILLVAIWALWPERSGTQLTPEQIDEAGAIWEIDNS